MEIGNNTPITLNSSAIKDSDCLVISLTEHEVVFHEINKKFTSSQSISKQVYTGKDQLFSILNNLTKKQTKTSISIVNHQFTIIPNEILSEITAKLVWETNYGRESNLIEKEKIQALQSTLLTSQERNFDEYSQFNFINTHSGVYFTLQYLLISDLGSSIIFTKKYDGYIHLFILKNGKLELANHYEFENSNDLCYFILLAAEKRNLNMQNTTLFFTSSHLDFKKEEEILNEYINSIKEHPFGSEFDLMVQTSFI